MGRFYNESATDDIPKSLEMPAALALSTHQGEDGINLPGVGTLIGAALAKLNPTTLMNEFESLAENFSDVVTDSAVWDWYYDKFFMTKIGNKAFNEDFTGQEFGSLVKNPDRDIFYKDIVKFGWLILVSLALGRFAPRLMFGAFGVGSGILAAMSERAFRDDVRDGQQDIMDLISDLPTESGLQSVLESNQSGLAANDEDIIAMVSRIRDALLYNNRSML